jgi:hypothetical protein
MWAARRSLYRCCSRTRHHHGLHVIRDQDSIGIDYRHSNDHFLDCIRKSSGANTSASRSSTGWRPTTNLGLQRRCFHIVGSLPTRLRFGRCSLLSRRLWTNSDELNAGRLSNFDCDCADGGSRFLAVFVEYFQTHSTNVVTHTVHWSGRKGFYRVVLNDLFWSCSDRSSMVIFRFGVLVVHVLFVHFIYALGGLRIVYYTHMSEQDWLV